MISLRNLLNEDGKIVDAKIKNMTLNGIHTDATGASVITANVSNRGRNYIVYERLFGDLTIVNTNDPMGYFKVHLAEDFVNDVLKLKKGEQVTVGGDITVICLD